MMWVAVALVALVGLFLSGFFSGAETGLYRVNRIRLHLKAQQRDPRAVRLAGVLSDEPGALCVTLVGTNMANAVTTSAVAYLVAESFAFGETDMELVTIALVTPIIFVFGEVVPNNLFRIHADTLLFKGSRLLAVADRLLRLIGVVAALTKLAALTQRLASLSPQDDDALRPKRRITALLQDALVGHAHGEDQHGMIDRICQLSETSVHRVMVPRDRVRVVAAGTDRRGLVRAARRTGHARLPVFDTHPRRIIGVVRVDELLQTENWETVRDRMRSPVTLPPDATVVTAIATLRREGRTLAVVTDRGGQLLGIVTLKDLLGEVVGDLAAGV